MANALEPTLPQNPLEGSIVDTDAVLYPLPKGMEEVTPGATPVETSVGDDGAAYVRIPIAVPPGRDGHAPNLALAYSSKGGDGSLGVGWSLEGLSEIARCGTDLSIDRERDARVWGSSALCLDGQRLVPDDAGHYRLRFGGRERIRLVGEVDDPASHFVADFPDGTRRVYGKREDARVWAHPTGEDSRPVRWLLERERDIHGNVVDYHYESGGVDEGRIETTQLSTIEYGHHETAPVAAYAKVSFKYRGRESVRTYHAGVASETGCELQSVTSEALSTVVRSYRLSHRTRGLARELTSVTECDGRDVCREPVSFEWTDPRVEFLPIDPTNESAPRLLAEIGGIEFGDPAMLGQVDRFEDGFRPSFEYRFASRERKFLRFVDGSWLASPSFRGSRIVPFDRDVDGDSEVLVADYDGSVRLYDLRVTDERLRLGGLIEDLTPSVGAQGILQGDFDGDGVTEVRGSSEGLHVLDFNGDGRADIVRAEQGRHPNLGSIVVLSPSSLFGSRQIDVAPEYLTFADVNGDGLLDAVEVVEDWVGSGGDVDSRLLIYINEGGLVGEPTAALRLGELGYSTRQLFARLRASQLLPVDLDRDGRDDLVVTHHHDYYEPMDGCDETWRVACQTRLDVVAYFSDGATWGDPVRLTSDDFHAAFGRPHAITWRDGTVAIAGSDDRGALAFRPIAVTDGSLLTSVTQGDRQLVEYEYDRFGSPTSHHERVDLGSDAPPLHPEQMREEDGLIVVNAHVDDLGRRFEHWYSDGRTERKTGRFLGFRRKLTYEHTTGRLRETVRDNATFAEGVGFPFAGIAVEENVYIPMGGLKQPDGYTIHRTVSKPELVTIASGQEFPSYAPVVISVIERVVEDVAPRWRPEPGWPELEVSIAPPLALYQGETVATRILRSGGVNTSHVMTELKHDGLGFVTETTTTTESSYESHAVATHDSRVDDERYMPWLPELVIRNTEADSGRRTTDARVLKYDGAGRLGSVTLRPFRSDWLETTYVRNELGLIERVQESAEGQDARVTQIKWDTWGLAPERVENAEGHLQLLAVHPAFGVPVVTVDPNGVVSRAAYDGFGRLRSRTTLAGTAEVVYGRAEGSERIAQRRPGEGWTIQVLDEHARPIRVQSEATEERSRVLEVEYDERGRLSRTTLPRFEGESTHVAMNYFYDELDRLTVAYPGASLYRAGVRHEYSPGRRRSFAADGGERRLGPVVDERYDSAGLLRSVKTTMTDAGTTSLQYEYGTAGLEVTTDQSGTQWATDVDALERPTSTYDPDAGSRSYRFNAFGEVEAELDDDGNELLVIERDRLGRPFRFVHRDEGVTTVEWDPIGGVGRPEWVYDEATGVRVTWAYEEETGRLSSEITTAPDGSEYVTSVKYDEFGRPELVTYGDVVIRYVYDELGNLEQIVNDRTGAELWRALELDAAGRVTVERWSAARGGDGRRVERRVDFDPRTGEVNAITLDRGLSRLEALSFVYDQLGRLESASSLKRARAETFKYDDLHRVRAWIIDGTEEAEYRYDDIGNLESRFGNDLRYENAAAPHQLTEIVGDGGATYVKYDERGRRYQWGAREVDYNRFDLPTHVRDAGAEVATYAYDGLGRRVWSNDERGETFYAAGGAWEVRRGNDGRRTTTVHLRAPSGTPIELVSNEGDSNLEVLYSLTDVLGSARATIDGGGDIVAFHDFDPFGAPTEVDGRPTGEIVGLPSGLDRGFTGHRHDPTGFIDMGGRVYDPMTASFLTPDPVVVDLTNRQALHPYSYVLNSPTNFTDPTGFAPAEYGDGGVWGGIAAGFVSAIAGLLGGKDSGKPGPAGVEQVWLENGDTRRSHDTVQRTPTADVRGVRRAQSSSATARSRDAGVVTVPHVELGMTRLSMHDFGVSRSYDDIVRVGATVAHDYVQEINARGRPSIMGIEVPAMDAPGMMADGITQFFDNVATVHDRQASGWARLAAGVFVLASAFSAMNGAKTAINEVQRARRLTDFVAKSRSGGPVVFRFLSADDAAALARGEGLTAKGISGSVAEHVRGENPTRFISASEAIESILGFNSGNGLVAIDVEKAVRAGSGFYHHAEVLRLIRAHGGDASVVRLASEAREVLFSRGISSDAIVGLIF